MAGPLLTKFLAGASEMGNFAKENISDIKVQTVDKRVMGVLIIIFGSILVGGWHYFNQKKVEKERLKKKSSFDGTIALVSSMCAIMFVIIGGGLLAWGFVQQRGI